MGEKRHYLGNTSDCPWGDSRLRKKADWGVLSEAHESEICGSELSRLFGACQKLYVKGQVLVDGHHVFLHALRLSRNGSQEWDRLAKKDRPSDAEKHFSKMDCPFDWCSPRVLSHVSTQIMHRAMDRAVECAVSSRLDDETRIIASDSLVAEEPKWLMENLDPKTDTLLHNDWEIIAFDAPMPDINIVLNDLFEFEKRRRYQNKRYEMLFERIKDGDFVHDLDGQVFEVPYTLKNEYIDDLTNNHFADAYFGHKKYYLNTQNSSLSFKEKQVDVLLTMALCDAAEQSDVNWICVVTNDSDYVPAIERLQRRGKSVVWVSADGLKPSRDLRDCVGPENSYKVDDLFTRGAPDFHPWFWELFGEAGLLAAKEYRMNEVLFPSDAEAPALTPWDKGVHEVLTKSRPSR